MQIRKEKSRIRKKQMKKNKNKGAKENKDEYKEPLSTINEGGLEYSNEPNEQSNQTKQETFPSNPSEEDHNNQSNNENDNIEIKHEQKDQKKQQLLLMPIKNDKQVIQIKRDENDKSDSVVPNSEEAILKEAENDCDHLNEEMKDREIEGNKNQKNTSAYEDEKYSVKTKIHKHYFPIKNIPKENQIKIPSNFIAQKRLIEKITPMSSSNHKMEPSDKEYFNMASMKDKKNAYIVNNINPNKNNKFSPDNFLLDPCKYSNHDEQGNNPCSMKKSSIESSCENLFSQEMEKAREADIEINRAPNLYQKYDGNEGDKDIDKVSKDGITNSQNVNANYGIYKKECAKDMKTEDNLHSNSISSSI